LSRLSAAARDISAGIEGFTFQDSINAAYAFAWNELCDWYLEAVKERLRDGDTVAQDVAHFCLDCVFRLLHPFMPFVTEELWSRLPGERDYLMRAEWTALHAGFVVHGYGVVFSEEQRCVACVRVNIRAHSAP